MTVPEYTELTRQGEGQVQGKLQRELSPTGTAQHELLPLLHLKPPPLLPGSAHAACMQATRAGNSGGGPQAGAGVQRSRLST